MDDSITVRVAGGVRLARLVLPLFGLLGLGLFTHPNPMRIFAGVFVIAVFAGTPLAVYAVWPRTFDAQGCTVGFGRRFAWSDLKDVRVIAQKRGARTVNHRFVLQFGSGSARFGYNQTVNAREVVAFLERILKRPLLPG